MLRGRGRTLPDSVRLVVTNNGRSEFECEWLIGADGANSMEPPINVNLGQMLTQRTCVIWSAWCCYASVSRRIAQCIGRTN